MTEVGKKGSVSRRAFLGLGGASAAAFVLGGLGNGEGPFHSLGARSAVGKSMPRAVGYGPLVNKGDLKLPEGFRYRIISRTGEKMSDGNPTPTFFDGMAAFDGPRNTTVLIRNHENRRAQGQVRPEIDVVVPPEFRYDSLPQFNAGDTKLVVDKDRRKVEDFAVLGGTGVNCAGGPTPWKSWITCEEFFLDGGQGAQPHGYIFEIDSRTEGPVKPVPIKQAGRFAHEAVSWHDGILYETEDRNVDAAFYRYVPDGRIRRPGQLAESTGTLQALKIQGEENFARNTDKGFPVGEPFDVEWVDIDQPDPPTDTVRVEAHAKGAALFDREEGTWVGNGGKVYFDCTSGGEADSGQIWEYDPDEETITLIYESPGPEELESPDNLVVVPKTGDIFLCEDGSAPQFVRGVTQEGEIYDFARSTTNESEFAGACFSPDGNTLFVNQHGSGPQNGVTYAIWGPFKKRRRSGGGRRR